MPKRKCLAVPICSKAHHATDVIKRS
jgi:hypothetical protein